MSENQVTDETLLDLDNVEDLDFDGIEAAPGFVDPPDGVYILNVTKATIESYKTKEGEARKRFAHYYQISKVEELADSGEQAPNIGDKFSERFMMNEQGIKYWKSKAKDIVGEMGKVSVANVLAALSSGDYSFKARVQTKKSKGKDGKEYRNVQVKVLERMDGDVAF